MKKLTDEHKKAMGMTPETFIGRCYYCRHDMFGHDNVIITHSEGKLSRIFHMQCGYEALTGQWNKIEHRKSKE